MNKIEIFDKRRRQVYIVHLILLSSYFIILFAEWLLTSWIFQNAVWENASIWTFWLRIIYLPVIVYNVILEFRISRHPDARKALDDEMDSHHRLLAWRNAFFGTMLSLIIFTILSEIKAPTSPSRVMGMVVLFGCSMFFATFAILGREKL